MRWPEPLEQRRFKVKWITAYLPAALLHEVSQSWRVASGPAVLVFHMADAAGEGAPLEDIARGQLAGFTAAVSIEGPHVFLKRSAAQSFALVIQRTRD